MAVEASCRECLRGIPAGESSQVWIKLNERFGGATPEAEMITLSKLIRLKCDSEPGSELHYLREFHELNGVLGACEILLPEKLLKVLMLEGLPPSYENITRYVFLAKQEVSLAELQSLIEAESQTRVMKKSEERTIRNNESIEALNVSRFKKIFRCYNCNKVGLLKGTVHILKEGSSVICVILLTKTPMLYEEVKLFYCYDQGSV